MTAWDRIVKLTDEILDAKAKRMGAMTKEDVIRVIYLETEETIELAPGDIVEESDGVHTIDGMDWREWLDAMVMD